MKATLLDPFVPGKGKRVVHLQLTERNLRALLAKLELSDQQTLRTLVCGDRDPADFALVVTAVRDEDHYSDRAPGPVTAITEQLMGKAAGGPQ